MPLAVRYIPKLKGRAQAQANDPDFRRATVRLTPPQQRACLILMICGVVFMLVGAVYLVILNYLGYLKNPNDSYYYYVCVGAAMLVFGAGGAICGGFCFMNSVKEKKRKVHRPSCSSEVSHSRRSSRAPSRRASRAPTPCLTPSQSSPAFDGRTSTSLRRPSTKAPLIDTRRHSANSALEVGGVSEAQPRRPSFSGVFLGVDNNKLAPPPKRASRRRRSRDAGGGGGAERETTTATTTTTMMTTTKSEIVISVIED